MELPRRIDLVVGVSGCGKTLLTRELILDHDRVIVIDHRDEYGLGQVYDDFERMALELEKRERFVAVWRGDPAMVDHIFHLAFALRRVCVVLEEAADYDPAELPIFKKAILTGRMPAQISLVAVTQRPQLLHPDYRSQVTGVYAFRNSELSALQWLRPYFGPEIRDIEALPPLRGKSWQWGATPAVTDFVVEY